MIPDYTSNAIALLARPSPAGQQLGQIGQLLGQGIAAYGKNQQAEQAAMQKQQEEQEALILNRIIRSDDQQAMAIAQQAYDQGLFDDDDMNALFSFSAEGPTQAMTVDRMSAVDGIKALGYETLLPNEFRDGKGSIKGVEGDLVFMDENENIFSQQTFIDQGGQKTQAVLTDVSGRGAEPVGKLTPINKMGQTVQQQIKDDAAAIEGATGAKADQARQVAQSESLVKQSDAAFEKAQGINNQLKKIDKAIDALNKGATSGVIQKRFPSFTKATIQLEEAAKELGIEVINSATFGALSAPELQLALDTALPLNLDEDDLPVYLQDKKNAMQKLQGEIIKLGKHLASGKTMGDWYDMQSKSSESLSDEELLNKYL